MAPSKRKRPSVDPGEARPSPHRPQNMNLGQHDERGGRRSSRGGQGGQDRGRGGRNNMNSMNNPNTLSISRPARSTPTGPMSPPDPRPSSAAQTPVQTPTVEMGNPINPKLDIAPFDYVFLTDDRISAWDTTGHREVILSGSNARLDEDTTDLSSIFQELTRAALDGRLDPIKAGVCVKDILGPDSANVDGDGAAFDAPTFFLDIFSMICEAENGSIPPVLKAFAAASGVSPAILRQKLASELLQDLGLTRETFSRVGVRQATNLLYRQANYNLLREETEGYSKLVTELFTTSANEPPSSDTVQETFERVKGLIGTFDLDVGRVLDITLDVFAAVLVKQNRFFVKLLRISSWWPRNGDFDDSVTYGGLPSWALPSYPGWMPSEEEELELKNMRRIRDTAFWQRARDIGLDAFFELGGRQLVDEETKKQILASKKEEGAELDSDRHWLETTGTFPPSGNRVAAQILGFKLRFYASDARDKDDILPPNLIYLTALLIKIGFISLRDIYPHLWPLDDDMLAVRETRRKELEDKEKARGGGASNALTMAGALPDDTLPSGGRTRETVASKSDATAKVTASTEDKEKLDAPADQKVLLLVNLLTIGAIPEALFILGRFPWLPEAYPSELIYLINRILNHSINDVALSCAPMAVVNAQCPPKKVPDTDQGGVAKGEVRLTQPQLRKPFRWPYPDKKDENDSIGYRFYWDEWVDNIPVCQSVDDIFTLCGTFLNLSGVNIGKDADLLTKLAQIGAKSLADDSSQHNLDRWQDLLKRLIVPALSLSNSTAVVNEVYEVLRRYPTAIRYSIYAEWFEGPTSRLPAMKIAFARTRTETQSTMKRISMTNLTAMARHLSKIAYGSPGIVFGIALSQIEAYTNLTEVVVECAKYFTDLGYDVLVWSLMSALGGKDRNRNSTEFALLPSRWLVALSRFSGKVFKRYAVMNLSPIIRYVNHQLYRGNSTDLVILKELIAQMAGIVPDTDFTDAQIHAMTGGELLRKQTLINLQDKRYESTKTAKRLMKGLTESRLAGELLVSIAQHRQVAIYKVADEDAHIKMLATMIDDTQLILFQYLDLLRSNMPIDEFDKHVPGIPELLTDFGLSPGLAFMIGRASIAQRISQVPLSTSNGIRTVRTPSVPPPSLVDVDGDSGMVTEVAIEAKDEGSPKPLVNGDAPKDDVEMSNAKDGNPPTPPLTDGPDSIIDPIQDILDPIMTTVRTIYPVGAFKGMSAEFYVSFWTSTLSNLTVPEDNYTAELRRIDVQLAALGKDRSDMTRAGMLRKEETKLALMKLKDDLTTEWKRQIGIFSLKKSRLLKHKSLWFTTSVKPEASSDAFLEKCIIPRVLLSPNDAEYCFKMIRFLHDNAVPHFRTLSFYMRLFRANRLRTIIFTCTVREAENFGRFLRLVLTDLHRWFTKEDDYEKEAWGKKKADPAKNKQEVEGILAGFAKAVHEDGKPKGFLSYDEEKSGFKAVLLLWHKALNTALRDCFEGNEWMHIRNAITILKSVVAVFPLVDFMGNNFIKQLEILTEREKGVREDLALTGNAVLVQLKKRDKKWIMVQAFGATMIASKETNGNITIDSTVRSELKPTAPEFQPNSAPKSLPTAMEVEDGEVDDAKLSAAAATKANHSTALRHTTPETKATTSSSASEVRKSRVLEEREKFKNGNAAKSSTVPSTSMIPRSDIARSSLRPNPDLPGRPESPFPQRDLLDRHPSRHGVDRDRRDPRDLRDPRVMDRSGRPIERPRDFSGHDRRPLEAGPPRDLSRPLDRISGAERVRPDPPPRWTENSPRENLERIQNGARAVDANRLSREMPPPRPGPQTERGPLTSSDRALSIDLDRNELINPERAALIKDNNNSRSNSPRRGRDEIRDRSRPQSPRASTEKDVLESRRDDRPGRNIGADVQTNNSRSRNDESFPPPAGPRSERPNERERSTAGDRSAFQPAPPMRGSMNSDHGRLNASPRQSDPNFGRLNPAPSTPDIPSGPRDRNIRGNRMTNNGPPPRHEGRPLIEMPRPPTPDKQPPTGPSSNRNPRRQPSGQFDHLATVALSGPNTITPISPAMDGLHPDRADNIWSASSQATAQHENLTAAPQPSIVQSSAPEMHPGRIRGFGHEPSPRQTPPMHQINNNLPRPNLPPVITGPPSGPKGAQQSPVIPGTNGFTAPTGPAFTTERGGRGGRRNMMSGINAILAPPTSIVRGRGPRTSGLDPPTPTAILQTPNIPLPPSGPPYARAELMRQPSKDGNPNQIDLFASATEPIDDGDGRSRQRGHSGRHSRRSSRSPARERDSKRGGPDEDRTVRNEYRDRSDRRGGERDSESHRHRAASPGTDLIPSNSREPGRESGRERERDNHRDSGRRDGREHSSRGEPHAPRDPHDPIRNAERGEQRGSERGSGRNRELRGEVRSGEERRDSRGSRGDGVERDGRKRRSEVGLDSRGDEKRARRG